MIEFAGLWEKLTALDNGDALVVLNHKTGKLLEHCLLLKDLSYKKVWDRSYSNELGVYPRDRHRGKSWWQTGCGYQRIPPNSISQHPAPQTKEIINTKVVCEVQEGKDDENCTRITVGGNLIFYPSNAGTNTASLELIKLMLNSVISRKGARFACIEIKKFTLTCQ